MKPSEILTLANQEQLMESLFGRLLKRKHDGRIIEHIRYHNPFREDNRPSCVFRYDANGKLRFLDPTHRQFCGDFVDIAKIKYNKPAYTALDILSSRLHDIKSEDEVPLIKKSDFDFEIEVGNNYQYYEDAGISRDVLHFFKITSVSRALLSTGTILVASKFSPIFQYSIQGCKTLYMPLGYGRKWLSNCSKDKIAGYEQLPESNVILIITKSLKDVVTLYKLGIPAIAAMSEAIILPVEVMDELKGRFKHIYTLMDDDDAGRRCSENYEREYGLPAISLSGCSGKDAFEVVQRKGWATLQAHLITKIKLINEQVKK